MEPKTWRLQTGLTLKELSKKTGFSEAYLCQVENGKRNGSFRLADAYHKVSDGQVTANDMRDLYKGAVSA